VLLKASPAHIRPPHTRSEKFFSFWERTLNQLQDIPFSIKITEEQDSHNGMQLQRVTFNSFDNANIHGYLLTPESRPPGPLIIYTHGYMGHCEVVWTWAQQGASVFGMDIRGFGQSKNAVTDTSKFGYALTGIQSEETSILRGAICDYIRGAHVANELLQNQQRSTIFYGKSFGGALACIAAALTDNTELLVAAVPTFAWAEGRRKLVTEGSGAEINEYIKNNPDREPGVMNVLSYFDTMNFAPLIKCNTLVGVGLRDPVVPAETVYAFTNHLTCPKTIREYPVSHSTSPEEILWENFEKEWFQLAISSNHQNARSVSQ
jgi:cephalosporin-C deacetylase